MLVIGLTGSIGTGKSTTAKMFAACGVRVLDADAVVHRLYAQGGAGVAPVGEAFPGVVVDGAIDREALAARVVGNEAAITQLEAIVHPLVRAAERSFLEQALDAHARAVILEIPLLFETGGERRCDLVVVTTAAADIQRERVLARPGMSARKLDGLLQRQMSDADKRRRAHFIVDTGFGLEAARRAVRDIMIAVSALTGLSREGILARLEAHA